MEPLKIGFVGLGVMGSPMAANLLKAGFGVSVYNRTPSKCSPLMDRGANVCKSLPDLASSSRVVITMVSDTPDVEAVLFGTEGLAKGLQPGAIVIDMSTISPSATIGFSGRLQEQGVSMLDAPVSGGETGAIAGTLSIMVGGAQTAYEGCKPLFDALGRTIVYAGPSGSGQKTKLVNQVIGALNLLAVVEGLRLATASELDIETTLKAVGAGAAGSWMVSNLGPKIAMGDFRPGFSIRLQQKDVRLASECFSELGANAPGTSLMLSLLNSALEKGLGELGNQGLYQLLA
jgi:3-hydroxyisobutyrate dehydrogenase